MKDPGYGQIVFPLHSYGQKLSSHHNSATCTYKNLNSKEFRKA